MSLPDDVVARVGLAITCAEYASGLGVTLDLDDLTDDGKAQCLRQARAALAELAKTHDITPRTGATLQEQTK